MPVNRTLSAAPDGSGGNISATPSSGHTVSKAVDLPSVPKLMAGKRGLVMGVANERSIAWGIAQALHAADAEMAFTYQGAAFGKRVLPMVQKLDAKIVQEADVESEESLDALFARLEKEWGRLDFVVHAIAFSDKEELKGRYVDTTKANFQRSLTISCYSFTEIARRALPLMTDGGSLITLTYEGATRVMPSYNVMGVAKAALEASVRYLAADLGPQGVRVNAISAGPMRTLAGAVIGSSRYVYRLSREASPLRRNMELSDIGGSALYYLSDLSAGVTGTVHYVDGGYHAMGMPPAGATGQNGDEGNGNGQ
ncbi:Enoyl-[acyl-carrier-protein] reductase [NADH] [Enhydrobacter aerosaccus]|uniref:Enoyl-[acyl-carrier-protein] reductase [NADH] n=2 Tax=Enhydrobacter aerosaccus TaxID=225324 RepID=A0A1T4TKJ2_9HYPH|nr:Enoyl-[acyl-carrier-protein] reductase [NADH] [Enhydrobacter aerosaccus]